MIDSLFKENIKDILEHIEDGIHIVDSNGKIIYYNKFAAQLDNVNPEEAIGRHILEIYPSLTPQTSTILSVIRDGIPILNYEQSFRNYKGKVITTINTTIPIKLNKKIIGAVEISKDITEVKNLTQKVVDLQAELLLDEKLKKKRREASQAVYNFADIIGTTDLMLKLKKDALSVSHSPSPVMVYGETGTGKELLVHAIHNSSQRKDKPFIAQNCAAIPETLLESILFGTVKGSFTGAENRPGLFELADGGTLFLDEVNSMSPNLQAKLLRVIQDSIVRRIGSTKVAYVDVRIMTTISTDPREALKNKTIRDDLFYRLSVISLRMPPLKERYGDIPLLCKYFIEKYNKMLDKNIKGIANNVSEFFMSYSWPGNIRELEHAIEGSINIAEGKEINHSSLPYYLQETYKKNKSRKARPTIKPLTETINKVEAIMITGALQRTGGNITKAAQILKVPRQTLQYKIGKYNIKV
ncbi:MAG: sigma 54-interacting transcriptional regulator [Firmicutes bacterium]|nr:sigma 54-interacting transcriptional regulator [Bacillota bacterium]